jgi:hypothetical protein
MQAGRVRTFELLAAMLACCVVLIASVWTWCSCAAWFGGTEQALAAIALLGTAVGVAAIARDDVRLRVLVSCVLLFGAHHGLLRGVLDAGRARFADRERDDAKAAADLAATSLVSPRHCGGRLGDVNTWRQGL